jgi:hypothetical protein
MNVAGRVVDALNKGVGDNVDTFSLNKENEYEARFKPGQVAKMLNVDIKTLQRWDRLGHLKAHRYPPSEKEVALGQHGRRYYLMSDIQHLLGSVISTEE